MPAFRYRALDGAGKLLTGVVNADTPRVARTQLRAQGLTPAHIAPVQAEAGLAHRWGRRIPPRDLSLLTRELAALLASGLTLERAFSALIDQTARPVVREVLAEVKSGIAAGLSFAAALGAYPQSFPDFYRALVRGAEQSGALPRVLESLADHLDARQQLKEKTGLALLYPTLVFCVAVAIVGGLLVYVVPQVVQVFQHSRQSLPLLTRALVALSDALRMTWPYIALAAGVAAGACRMALRRPRARRRWHALLLRLPVAGDLVRSAVTARFASTLAIQLGGGVPLIAALSSAGEATGNLAVQDAVAEAIAHVREGVSLGRALGASRLFSPMLVHLVASGEASGKLDDMLGRAAMLETKALERKLAVFTTLLEPAMILVMGGFVLLIVLAILLPVIEMNQLVR